MKINLGAIDIHLHRAPDKNFTNREFKDEFRQFCILNEKNSNKRFEISWDDRYPRLDDRTTNTSFDAHYTYHPAWAARIVSKLKPEYHIDISSILHFSTMVSAFIPVKFYDYRPPALQLNNLTCNFVDLNSLPFETNSVASLSCMHTIEHIGLGRYGDKLDPEGDLKAISELKRVVMQGGSLLFVVPVGQPKIMFNAHRVYSHAQIMEYFSGFILEDFSLVTDDQNFVINAPVELANTQKYGCGCFWFVKK